MTGPSRNGADQVSTWFRPTSQPLCAYADTAVRLLTRQGRPAARLVDGLPEWAAEGLPVEVGG